MYEQKLTQKASQSLVLSKQMQQSLKILQMNSTDLISHVETQLETNPFLEISANDDSVPLEKNNDKEQESSESQWQEESYLRYEKNYSANSNDRNIFENLSNDNISLKEHLLRQISLAITDTKEKFVALYLTDILDENGYLSENLDQIQNNLKVEKEVLKSVLIKLHKLDPHGAYAQNLSDCLRIQLKETGVLTDELEVIVNNLDLIASGEIKKFYKTSGISEEILARSMETIKKLDPKPGRNYGLDNTRMIIPDAFINISKTGKITASLNSNSLPKVFVNSKYFNIIISSTKDKTEKKFCSENIQNANWLIKAIQQRADTIFRVSQEIANLQYEFFLNGISYLKPMTLSDIAKKLGVHESTISRISNKILATPMGTYEIKYFFNAALSSNISEDSYSATSVKQKIKDIISNENNSKIYSDGEIAIKLNEIGVNISRRTIAKYREQLCIPPSNQRKRLQFVSNI